MHLKFMFFREKIDFFSKNFQIFKSWKFFEKNRIFKKIIKLQIALKYSLFKLWTNQKICKEIFKKVYINENILGARALARAVHARPHIGVKIQ